VILGRSPGSRLVIYLPIIKTVVKRIITSILSKRTKLTVAGTALG